MDATSIDLFTTPGNRDQARKPQLPAPGFEQHLADGRPRIDPAPDKPRPPRAKSDGDRRGAAPAGATVTKQKPAKDSKQHDDTPPSDSPCCSAQADASQDSSPPPAPDKPADRSADSQDAAKADDAADTTIVAAALVAAAVAQPDIPAEAPASTAPAVQVAPVTEAIPTDTPAAKPGDQAAQAQAVTETLPDPTAAQQASDQTQAAEQAGPAMQVAEQAAPAVAKETKPVAQQVARKDVKPVVAAPQKPSPPQETAAKTADDQTATSSTDASQPHVKRPSLTDREPSDTPSDDAAPATTAPAPVAFATSAIAPDAPAASDKPPSASKPDADNGPAPISAANASPKAADVPAPPPLSSRLPAHLVGRGERADQPSRLHDIDQARILQRVARAFETASARDGDLRIRLSPPELGSLRLELKVQEGVMSARIEAETPEARAILIDNLSSLRERLAEQNMKIDRFDVDLMDRNLQGQTPHQQDDSAPSLVRNSLPRTTDRGGVTETDSAASQVILAPGKLNVVV
jgi:flagellar hook-length control protein FliK